MKHRRVLGSWLAVLAVGGCTTLAGFDKEYTLAGADAGAGLGASGQDDSSSFTPGSSPASSGVGGNGGAGSMSGSSASSTGGQGGGGQGGGGQGGGAGGTGGADCTNPDADGDGAISMDCMGTDCDDNNKNVFPGQPEFFNVPRVGGSFDYNCNGTVEHEFETYACKGMCAVKTNVFIGDAPVACGQVGAFGDCSVVCGKNNLTTKTKRCH